VLDVTAEAPGGWLIRGVHHWAAQLFVAIIVVHVLHAFFTRAYRAPRQANWVVGALILPVVFGLHFSGTVLPWDQDAYWVAAKTLKLGASLPVLGTFLERFAQEAELSSTTLGRAFALHVVLLPWTLFFLLSVHLRLIWRHGIAPPMPPPGGEKSDESMLAVLRADTTAAEAAALRAGVEKEGVRLAESALEGRTIFRLDGCRPALAEKLSLDPRVKEVVGITPALAERTFYPRHFLRIVGAMLALAGALVLLAAWLPPSIKGPADSFHPPATAPIPWYVLWFQGLQTALPQNLKLVGSLLVILGSLVFIFFPLLDAHDGGRPRRPWLSWVAGIVGIIALVALTLHGAGLT
jgi:quinol-cytochrome oxidoreductase complex cytochrome b subunit